MAFEDDCFLISVALADFVKEGHQSSRPVIRQTPMPQLADNLDLTNLIKYGGLEDENLVQFLNTYLQSATNLHHPAFMAHQVAVPSPNGTLAAMIDSMTNNGMAIYEMGPPAATIEHVVLNWMLEKIGWTPAPFPTDVTSQDSHGGGVLTHGGSLAQLTALAAARAHIAPDAWTDGVPDNLVMIAPPSCHYSISRSAGILGLGSKAVIAAPVDNLGRIIPAELAVLLETLTTDGKRIMAVVANACCTSVGLYDDLKAVATICREKDVWLHVDGAHGASALTSEKYKHLLDGASEADSLIWDAHKMLQSPVICAAVLVRDSRHLDNAFQEDASYLFHDKDQPGFDFVHRTVECTKAALGLKIFFTLARHGEDAMGNFVERQTDLAVEAAAYFAEQPDFTVAVTPQSNIVCFRIDGSDALQLAIRKHLIIAGDWYISSTEFSGQRWLRVALMNPITTIQHIKDLSEAIRMCAHNIKESFPLEM